MSTVEHPPLAIVWSLRQSKRNSRIPTSVFVGVDHFQNVLKRMVFGHLEIYCRNGTVCEHTNLAE
jgi:hypothetical protein